MVFGLGGNDVIAAGTLPNGSTGPLTYDANGLPIVDNPLNIPVILDGGAGQSTLIGGNSDDVIYLNTGDDTGYGMGGNDTYVLTPNCDLNVTDNSGNNTLDFSQASQGVTFNLNEIQGQTQVVSPG